MATVQAKTDPGHQPVRSVPAARSLSEPPPASPTASIDGDRYILVRKSRDSGAIGKAAAAVSDSKYEPVPPELKMLTLVKQPSSVGKMSVVGRGGKAQTSVLRIRVPQSVTLSCAVTGITTGVVSLLIDANTTEYNALLALYDQYRFVGAVFKYALPYVTPAGGTAGVGPDAALSVVAYDPADASALTSVRNGTELSQHDLRSASPILGTATSSATMKYGFQNVSGKPYTLNITPTRGAMTISGAGAVSSSLDGWKSMNNAGSNIPDGYIKVYNTSDYTTVSITVSGDLYALYELRSRK